MASIRREVGASNISMIMSGIRACRIAQDIAWNGNLKYDTLIKGVQHAVSSSIPLSTLRPLRDLVCLEHLCCFVVALNPLQVWMLPSILLLGVLLGACAVS